MSNFYENVQLREEFILVQKLQKDNEVNKYLTIQYEDRVTGELRSVIQNPSNKYPESFIVEYRLPVYVNEGQLEHGYRATAKIILSEVCINGNGKRPEPQTFWNSNYVPYNNHVKDKAICTGNAWTVAKGFGLWYYIIALGALVNQDEFVCAEGYHFNSQAYLYWLSRGKKPVTNIKWPYDLHIRQSITFERQKTEKPAEKKIIFTKK